MALLTIRHVSKSFGGVRALEDVSFDVAAGELIGLIGPNGSGKTTLINILSGHQSADRGEVLLDGQSLLGLSPDRIARRGVLRMFQLTRGFGRITALDNLLVTGRALGLDSDEAHRRAERLLDELTLTRVMNLDARQLSGGQQKLLEFGSCFMVPPRLALLDEPFAAVHPTMRQIMADFVRKRHAEGQTFILVSHDMPIVMELCPRTVCMNAGTVIADEATRLVLDDPVVIEAYLGGQAA
ncbi:ABC transporter ATP-binding protein [Microvirga massiliensis]|uniref:ABC transporter ATP-binding protein n=1 Tax=Microvirga massiliensis TaxID=1033741 RepID=UPI00062B9848|nr:ATP-binding cassette domain-containing protein [Microvirga massiliensis]